MTVLFCVLLFAFETGLTFHEIAGIAIFFVFFLHVTLNWRWVKRVTLNFFCPNTKGKTRLMYLLNLTLFIGVALIVVTGIMISQVLFPAEVTQNHGLLVTIHRITSYVCAGLFGVHLALHGKYLVTCFKRIVNNFREPAVRRAITGFLAVGIIAAVLYFPIAAGFSKSIDEELASYISSADAGQSVNESSDQTQNDALYEGKGRNGKNKNETSVDLQETQDTDDAVSLSDFLGSMFCTGCHKHCSLLSPQCITGEKQAQAAEVQYEELYGETTATD